MSTRSQSLPVSPHLKPTLPMQPETMDVAVSSPGSSSPDKKERSPKKRHIPSALNLSGLFARKLGSDGDTSVPGTPSSCSKPSTPKSGFFGWGGSNEMSAMSPVDVVSDEEELNHRAFSALDEAIRQCFGIEAPAIPTTPKAKVSPKPRVAKRYALKPRARTAGQVDRNGKKISSPLKQGLRSPNLPVKDSSVDKVAVSPGLLTAIRFPGHRNSKFRKTPSNKELNENTRPKLKPSTPTKANSPPTGMNGSAHKFMSRTRPNVKPNKRAHTETRGKATITLRDDFITDLDFEDDLISDNGYEDLLSSVEMELSGAFI